MTKLITERRAHERVPKRLEVQGESPRNGEVARMVASNLSIGGLYCSSSAGFPEMTRLAVRLMLPPREGETGEDPLEVEAVVVRRRQLPSANGDPRFELALYFTRIDDAQRRRLSEFLHS